MAITALNSAATGLRALSTKIDVTANNLANAETTAFKRSRVNFEDLMYLQLKQPGTTNSTGEPSPAGIYVGLGTRISNTQLDTEQGSMESTNRQLDVGIQGSGFFGSGSPLATAVFAPSGTSGLVSFLILVKRSTPPSIVRMPSSSEAIIVTGNFRAGLGGAFGRGGSGMYSVAGSRS